MTARDRAERAGHRAARTTARVQRRGASATVPEPVVQGTPAVELACELTLATQTLLGQPVRVIPRAEWPGAVHISGAETWRGECGVQYEFGGLTDRRAVAGDGVVTIEIVRSGWAVRGFPPNADATTEVVYGGVSGDFQIVDADIYLRADAFDFEAPSVLDRLAAVAAHEFGHVLGLRHSCGEAGVPSCTLAGHLTLLLQAIR